jgi:CubicO group peptidase (beta-lactamase class C family)
MHSRFASRLCACALALYLSGCVGVLVHVVKHIQKKATEPAESVTGTGAVPAAVRAALEDAVKHGAPGVTAIVMRHGAVLFRVDVGTIAHDAPLPVASATKWMTAALVMSVVDEGRLSLDAPVSNYLPAFKGPASEVTLRELLAQTSGEGSIEDGVDIRQDPRITLAQSAAQIASRPLVDAPGTVFKYGGPGFQVAGAAVEAVTGKRWAQLFDDRIARPLGMAHTSWLHLPAHGVSPAETLNPLLQGGVVTTADDYMRFLGMLVEDGKVGNRRILSARAVDEMEALQTLGKPMAYVPPGARSRGDAQYALGNWCETWDTEHRCTLVSSPGAFGSFPWIDRQSGLYGIFFTRDRATHVADDFIRARRIIIGTYATKDQARIS